MNVYQKVLIRLYEETGGRDSKAVPLKDIVKELGFLPSYEEIFNRMSGDGWITETSHTDEVNITPWGVREARKVEKGGGDNTREVEKSSNKIKSEVKELLVMTEELAEKATDERLKAVEDKLKVVSNAVDGLKKLL
ncbi:MAG: hypothetical protein HKN33_10350 [Pyrinomonadaceae bacterium]|nr:hypothetical protein [Pyrinomonadaceae bacterium]